jgi:hypothetical protein
VIYSTDGGFMWKKPSNIGFDNKQTEYITSLVVSGNHIFAISSLNNIYYSWDSGDDWTKPVGNGLPANASYLFSIASDTGTFFLGSSAGILKSTDGTHWVYSTVGMRSAYVSELASYGGKIFAETERGVSYSANAGSDWHDPQNLTDLGDVSISDFLTASNQFYAFGAGLYSWDGSTWTQIDTGEITALAEGESGKLFASRRSTDPISGEAGLFISDNGGSRWDSLLTFTNTIDSEFYFIPQCMSSRGPSIVAILHTLSFQTYEERYFIYRSSDNGSSWHVSETLNSPAFIYYSGGVFYMGTYGGGLYSSNDDGATWLPQTGLGSKSDVTSLIKTGSLIFALIAGNGILSDGIYGSGNNGYSWKYVSDDTHHFTGPLVSDGIYLYTCGPSVWKRPLSELGVSDVKIFPFGSALEPYPNPADEIIHLHVNSSDPVHGTLFVTDERGAIVMKEEMNDERVREDIFLSVANLSEGAYYTKILDKSGFNVGSSQFVVMRK